MGHMCLGPDGGCHENVPRHLCCAGEETWYVCVGPDLGESQEHVSHAPPCLLCMGPICGNGWVCCVRCNANPSEATKQIIDVILYMFVL